MRKGILALMRPGKAAVKKKAKATEPAEKLTAAKVPPTQEHIASTPQEKPFVQTIQVPKPGTVHKKSGRKGKKSTHAVQKPVQ